MSALEQVRAALGSDPVDRGAIATILDGVDVHERVTIVRSLGGREQAALWDASDGQNVTLEELVPPAVGPATEVIHAGKNSLPVFTKFEKRFCSTADDGASLYGYNEGPTRALVGPGYFVAHVHPETGSACVDYLKLPPDGAKLPAEWPQIEPQTAGLSRFVYAGMIDHLRRVSKGVLIGRAERKGKMTSNYFLLCRQE